jgi:POT family proton-dependent oligopeptide transporter
MRDEYLIMLAAWTLVGIWVALVILANRKVHPKVLFLLFMVELWERFSYYGMRALLILYLTSLAITGGFNIPKDSAYGIYAAYGALVYLTPLAGGILADRILGFRKAIFWGAVLMACGQFTLALSAGNQQIPQVDVHALPALTGTPVLATPTDGSGNLWLMYLGLALLVLGNGFFKPNISSLIGRYYEQGDPRRDSAFTIFYMGINIGAFLTPLTCGTIGEIEGWSYGFMTAGLGMCLGLIIFWYTAARGYLGPHAEPPGSVTTSGAASATDTQEASLSGAQNGSNVGVGPVQPSYQTSSAVVYLGTFAAIPLAMLLIYRNEMMDMMLLALGLVSIAYMIKLSLEYDLVERQRMWVIILLLFFTTVFWSFFELAGSAINIFTQQNVNKNLGWGIQLTTSNFQAVNPLFIMIFAPFFSVMWVWLAQRGWEPAAPIKFAIGLALLGAGFLILNLGKAAAVDALVPALFLILMYLLHTLGELALSPVGLSLVTKLAPTRIAGLCMGFWFLSSAIAHQAGKWISRLTVVPEGSSRVESLEKSLEVFNMVGIFALIAAGILLALSPTIKRWMHGVR